jgi:uncharacterized glyoxalase superfamily protein PhnB
MPGYAKNTTSTVIPAMRYRDALRPPREIGGAGTQSAFVIVDDVDAHYARAKAAGAEIVTAVEGQSYGGRLYSCRDPEGHCGTSALTTRGRRRSRTGRRFVLSH